MFGYVVFAEVIGLLLKKEYKKVKVLIFRMILIRNAKMMKL